MVAAWTLEPFFHGDVWNQIPGMDLLLGLLSGREHLRILGKSFQMTGSKAVQPTEVLLHVTPYKGASALCDEHRAGNVSLSSEYKTVMVWVKPSLPGPLLASI